MLIDWHSHHTAPEVGAKLRDLGGREAKPDAFDSPDFATRLAAMDKAGVDLQLVSQGAGLNADALPAQAAVDLMRMGNDLVAERVAPFPHRLRGTVAVTYSNPQASADEIERMSSKGFSAVMMYARPDHVGAPETELLFAKAAEHRMPVFLHGGANAPRNDPTMQRLEDGGQGVNVSVMADAAVSEFVVRAIAAGVFDRHPDLRIVVRSSGGSLPLLLNKLWWKHKTVAGEQCYSEVLRQHCLVDCANGDARVLAFLIDSMGESNVVFGSDFCGGLGPLDKAVKVIEDQAEPDKVRQLMERNSRRLLGL